VPLLDGDPYAINVGPPAALSTGGLLMPLEGNDQYNDVLLPTGFSFPFFGQTYTELTLSTNGNIYFSDPPRRNDAPGIIDDADDAPGSPFNLSGYAMIAGLGEDLDLSTTNRPDAGVYFLQPDPTRLIYRWQGVPCNFSHAQNKCLGGNPVNFEIELRTDGTIKTRYGKDTTNTNT